MNILLELFIVFFKLGAFTIGGGIAMLPLLQNTLINEKKWFTKEEFMDIKKKGLMGSIVSTFGVVIPSFTMILIIAKFITSLGDNRVLMGAMAGLRAAALGMVAVAMIQLMPAAVKNIWALLAAAAAFVLIAVLKVNTAYVILLFAALGIAVTFAGGRRTAAIAAEESSTGGVPPEADEGGESE